jgi:hypothetical protein
MVFSITSQSQPISTCHTVLLFNRDLAKTIFSILLAEQRVATRNLKEKVGEEESRSFSEWENPRSGKLGNEKKVAQAAKALKEGTRNMEVLRSVCREWNKIILGNKEFHFFLLFTRAKRVVAEQACFGIGGGCLYEFAEILRIEALGDPEGIAFTWRNFPRATAAFRRNRGFEHIRDALSSNNYVYAKLMADAFERPREKVRALCEIAKIDPQVIPEAKVLVSQMNDEQGLFANIAIVEALHNNFDEAVILLKKSGCKNKETFSEFAKAGAKHNLGAVKEWASQINDPSIQAWVQLEIALIEGDSIGANEQLSQYEKIPVRNSHMEYFKKKELAEAYIKLAKLDKSLGYVKAKEYISLLSPGLEKVKLLIEIAELDEKPNFNEAKQVAALAPVPNHNCDSQCDRYSCYDRAGDNQFCSIALAEAKYNVDAAKVTAGKIVNNDSRVRAKCNIELVRGQINAAQVAAMWFDSDNLAKTLTFIEIARKDPRHDLTEAKVLIPKTRNVVGRVRDICKIAEIVLEFPQDHYELRKDKLESLFLQLGRTSLV